MTHCRLAAIKVYSEASTHHTETIVEDRNGDQRPEMESLSQLA